MSTTLNPPSFCESVLNGAIACEDASLQIFQYGILNTATGSTAALGLIGISRAAAYVTGGEANTVRTSLLSSRYICILNIVAVGFTTLGTVIAAATLAASVAVKCAAATLLGRQITWDNWSRA